jgi:hypothetical protein
MAMPEPTTAFGLWPAVKARTGWPETDEAAMVDLFFGWLDAAAAMGALKSLDLGALAKAWPDAAGQALVQKLGEVVAALGEVERTMTGLAGRAGQFALDVEHVKKYIHEAINQNLFAYGVASIAPTFIGRDAQDRIVSDLATAITDVMTAAAERIRTGPPGDPNRIIAELAQARTLDESIAHLVQDNANAISALADVTGDASTVISAVSDLGLEAGPPGWLAKLGAEGLSTMLGQVALGGHLLASAGGADVPVETIRLDTLGLLSPLGTPVLLTHAVLEASEEFTGETTPTIVDDINKYWVPDARTEDGDDIVTANDPVLGSYNPLANAAASGGALDAERHSDLLEERARSRGRH